MRARAGTPAGPCSRSYASVQQPQAGTFQVVPHRRVCLPLIALADRSFDRLVLAPIELPCLAAKRARGVRCETDAPGDVSKQRRQGIFEHGTLAGTCDREVEVVIGSDAPRVTVIVLIGLCGGGLNGSNARSRPASCG